MKRGLFELGAGANNALIMLNCRRQRQGETHAVPPKEQRGAYRTPHHVYVTRHEHVHNRIQGVATSRGEAAMLRDGLALNRDEDPCVRTL